MLTLLFGKPLVFWFGLIALVSFVLQIYLGYRLSHGHPELLKYHRLNAIILACIVGVHIILGLSLYYQF
jgi:hypothetical protein